MSRYDKYEPKGGGFRAPLAAAWAPADVGVPFGVGLDATGKVVKGAGNSGIRGVLILTMVRAAGDIVDVQTDGEIVEFSPTSTGTPAPLAGTNYFADGATGALVAGTGTATGTAPATAGSKFIGHTVEATRLVVRADRNA